VREREKESQKERQSVCLRVLSLKLILFRADSNSLAEMLHAAKDIPESASMYTYNVCMYAAFVIKNKRLTLPHSFSLFHTLSHSIHSFFASALYILSGLFKAYKLDAHYSQQAGGTKVRVFVNAINTCQLYE